ncbi:GNAT family N-acetyltransferase [Isoptericola sp. NEAU-Y5]|uniref:GNAT family N-acetyltransferase n=1 Tax=Isoptericola luteus TaxID=2879484 RepID=A0ABS7ZHX7_9MICO|nr:GNAT family N-acetyltransferase [Isoptericola sp. NEAU-Y5]MCA5893901.1 GNAT family N-acetyltransferase [Isoptericola sp. NEAU-Y5]
MPAAPTSDPDYEFSADTSRVDVQRVHALLAEHAYWAAGRPLEVHAAAVAGSRNYGIYRRSTGEQVAYARIVTDGATFAWLADVIVDPAHRGRGLGTTVVTGALADVEPLGLRRVLLKASDEGRVVYERLGFVPLDDPAPWLVRLGS